MRARRRAAAIAFAIVVGSMVATAVAEPHLVIATSGTGTLPIGKIEAALHIALPDLSFAFAPVPDQREGVPSARLVRWSDGRVAVGFRDALGREDVRIVDPGPEPATAIATAFVELREALLAEPVEREIEEEPWPEALDGSRSLEAEARLPDAPRAHPSPEPRIERSALPIGRLSLVVGLGDGSSRFGETSPVEPYGLVGADFAFFPGRLHGLEGVASGLGVVLGYHARGGGHWYSSSDIDAAFALQLPFTTNGDHWFRLRAGYRWLEQSLGPDTIDVTRVGYLGALAGAEVVFLISSEMVFTAGLTVHAVSRVSGARVSADDDTNGVGWMGRLGFGNRGPVEWSWGVEIVRYEVDLGEQEAAQTNVQAVLGLGYRL